jgi:hypothetical protein
MQGEFWRIENKQRIDEVFANLKQHILDTWDWAKPLALQVKPYEGKRSLDQNALFHVWIREMVAHFKPARPELDEEEMKSIVKYRFLGTESIKAGKIMIENQLRHTSKLKRGEMYEFMEQLNQWCLDLGLNLTVPDDSEFMQIRRSQA